MASHMVTHHDHEADALPQAAGQGPVVECEFVHGNKRVPVPAAGQGDTLTADEMPVTMPVTFGAYLKAHGRVAIASSKTGPAFDTTLATDLARSLQAQGVAACGDLLSAISRKCWPDIMAAWPRVIATLNLRVSNVPVVLSAVDYDRMLHTVVVAMGSAQDITAAVKWQHVDTVLRSSAATESLVWLREAVSEESEAYGLTSDHDEVARAGAPFRAKADLLARFARGER